MPLVARRELGRCHSGIPALPFIGGRPLGCSTSPSKAIGVHANTMCSSETPPAAANASARESIDTLSASPMARKPHFRQENCSWAADTQLTPARSEPMFRASFVPKRWLGAVVGACVWDAMAAPAYGGRIVQRLIASSQKLGGRFLFYEVLRLLWLLRPPAQRARQRDCDGRRPLPRGLSDTLNYLHDKKSPHVTLLT